jgi:hypothetical protein
MKGPEMIHAVMKAFAVAFFLVFGGSAWAADCPPNTGSCKVITLNPDEEKALTGQNMVLDSAEWARRLDLSGIATYFRDKIKSAPAGTVAPEPSK